MTSSAMDRDFQIHMEMTRRDKGNNVNQRSILTIAQKHGGRDTA